MQTDGGCDTLAGGGADTFVVYQTGTTTGDVLIDLNLADGD